MKYYKYRISRKSLEICYTSFIRPLIEYGDILYDSCTKELSQKLEAIQLEAARIVTGAKKRTSHSALYKELGWQSLEQRRHTHKLLKCYSIIDGSSP